MATAEREKKQQKDPIAGIRASSVPVIERLPDSTPLRSDRWMVVIYNNDDNSVDEVIAIIMQATGCDLQEAMIETWEAHTFGKAPVHFASKPECEQVSGIIGEIGVKTEVCPEWND